MKYLKLILLLITISLSTGCFEKEVTTEITLANNLRFNYGDDIYLYDLISITDGSIMDENYLLNSDDIGEKQIEVNYKDSNKHKQKYQLTYEIVDNISPILNVSKNIYVTKDSNINLLSKTLCGDNADRNLQCEVIGDYDLKTIGSYPLTFEAKDASGNKVSKESTLHVIEKYQNNTSTSTDGTPLSYFFKNYKKDNNEIGIDVSEHQGIIDYQKVKEEGIDFVIIRMGFGPDSNGIMTKDKYFEENYNNAKEAGLKVGVYLFSYATTFDEIDIQTNWIKEQLQGKTLDLPISYDWESWNTFYSCKINFKDLNDMAIKFMNNLKQDGYEVMNYGSAYYLKEIWTTDKYPTWLAQYNKEVTIDKDFIMWQITDDGIVDGINTLVDIDILYK